ncbi:MAG TPA: TonB-dependent receptor [Burkholderiales bacterium]|jgi:iron complex outermembrane receptor protein|nr:TonB-dependent receptor [Burkholderiales bacterium]
MSQQSRPLHSRVIRRNSKAAFDARRVSFVVISAGELRGAVGLLAAVTSFSICAAQPTLSNLADLSLEQLGDIRVTSVSRQAERWQDAPASIYVITAEDIRRSGVNSLPEALRLAPNLEVAAIDSRQYAISARGFNNGIGNKLLVLIDGRTVYTPLFSGVFWDHQDIMLADVARIEVISGPGAALWGANAVNGVINVITRSSKDTQGVHVEAGGGPREQSGAARLGGRIGENGHYRIYAIAFDRDNTRRANGTPLLDDWNKTQGGFRADWETGDRQITLQGDAYQAKVEIGPLGQPDLSGFNLLARWSQKLENDSEIRLQAYYDHTERNDVITFKDEIDLVDIEFQHVIPNLGPHNLIWGAGHRYAHDRTENRLLTAFIPAIRDLRWSSVFLQDEVSLTDNIDFTLGGKLESNIYTGWEFLPSMRLAWKPSENQLFWGAASRAVRAPSRIDREFFFPGNPPFLIRGGPNVESEISDVFEIGHRAQASPALSYSITAFRHLHDKLRSGQPAAGGGFFVENGLEGTTSGVEAWGNYQVTPAWRLSAGMVELRQHLQRKSGSLDPTGPSALGNDPQHQWTLRSLHNLTSKHELDIMVRQVGSLPDPAVSAYTAVDVRFGWKPTREVEMSLTVRNAFDPGHIESGARATASEIERGAFVKLVWRI